MSRQPLVNAVSTSQIGVLPLFSGITPNPSVPTVFGTPGPISTPATRSNRHTRRCAFYYRRYYRAFEVLSQPLQDAMQCRKNPGQAPLFTKEEIEIYKDITRKLADMYNKRFDGYRRLIAEEKGLEHAPYTKINKHILKCVEL